MVISVREFPTDATRAALPRAESHIVVRFGATSPTSLDVHAIGPRARVHRKLARRGSRIVLARLPLGSVPQILGVPAHAIAHQIVPLDDLWGPAAQRLRAELAASPGLAAAATLVEQAIARRTTFHSTPIAAAADRLAHATVREVALELGVSERHLRRLFHDAVGLSPKTFARLTRFHRALASARSGTPWTRIAAASGYYDQAHLIDEFHAIAGTTPRSFLGELVDAVA